MKYSEKRCIFAADFRVEVMKRVFFAGSIRGGCQDEAVGRDHRQFPSHTSIYSVTDKLLTQ